MRVGDAEREWEGRLCQHQGTVPAEPHRRVGTVSSRNLEKASSAIVGRVKAVESDAAGQEDRALPTQSTLGDV